MARSFAKVFQRIWADPAWRALDVDSQHLYMLLISQPSMNLAGVLPLQARKWAACVSDWDTTRVEKALSQLTHDRFTVVDENTEEVLVRSLIRNDEAYRTPGMLKSILRLAEGVQSRSLRAVMACELGRLPALEGKTGPDGMAAIVATRASLVVGLGPEDVPREPIADGIGDGIHDGMADGIGDTFLGTHRRYLPQSATDTIADTSVSVSGSVSGVPHVEEMGGKSAPPPPDEAPICAKHEGMDRDAIPDCRACKRLRENWEAIRTEAAKPPPKPPWCGECNPHSRLTEPDEGPSRRCPACHPYSVAS